MSEPWQKVEQTPLVIVGDAAEILHHFIIIVVNFATFRSTFYFDILFNNRFNWRTSPFESFKPFRVVFRDNRAISGIGVFVAIIFFNGFYYNLLAHELGFDIGIEHGTLIEKVIYCCKKTDSRQISAALVNVTIQSQLQFFFEKVDVVYNCMQFILGLKNQSHTQTWCNVCNNGIFNPPTCGQCAFSPKHYFVIRLSNIPLKMVYINHHYVCWCHAISVTRRTTAAHKVN